MAGRCELRPVKGNLLYLKSKKSVEYIAKKLRKFSRNTECKFGCFNSLDLASEQGREMIIAWIEQRIGLK